LFWVLVICEGAMTETAGIAVSGIVSVLANSDIIPPCDFNNTFSAILIHG